MDAFQSMITAMNKSCHLVSLLSFALTAFAAQAADSPLTVNPVTPARLFPLSEVRLLPGPFSDAVDANREYLLAHDPDRLLAPFLKEAGLEIKKPPYPNWESMGLQGHTAGHYLSALSQMIASGNDPDGELNRRLDYMLAEMQRVQRANGNGYIGAVSESQEFWNTIAAGEVGKIWDKWVPWYNVHKTFAGLRDAYVVGSKQKAKDLLLNLGDWCVNLTSKLSDEQMQQMLSSEHGGMNEVMADIYQIAGDLKYLETAIRFNHRAVMEPLMQGQDRLTGLHANTQIPKIIGLEEIATLTDNQKAHSGARFFWNTVVNDRSIAFGGNSVSEHFNDPKDFSKMIEHREGPENCNTYNMLRLTEVLFESKPSARFADFYERALFNHILSSIDPKEPGYVYFTPLRPEHYRVYSQPEKTFWCCVGTGMENPGRYGQFIYARDKDAGFYVNLFIASELKTEDGITLRQENRFPFEPRTHLSLELPKPAVFSLHIRHPWWVPEGKFSIRVNGKPFASPSHPSTYAEVRRQWNNGDTIDVELPMHISAEPLPDGSDWAAVLYGPIVLAARAGTDDMVGERADDGRMAHVATGPVVPLDQVPCLITTADELPQHIAPDPEAGPLHFRVSDVVEPETSDGIELEPFFALHHERYQMYWELTTTERLKERKERLAISERLRAAREAATLDWVAPGEQQSEVEHDFQGERSETGIHNGRRWRHGKQIQYTLDTRGEKAVELSVMYSGDDAGRTFEIYANDELIATQELKAEKPGAFIEKRYELPASVLASSQDEKVIIRFVATRWLAGGVYDVRLMRPGQGTVDKQNSISGNAPD
jgi:DUF1680 family protein